MNAWFRHLFPFGLVRASQIRSDLIRLGLTSSRATQLALRPSTPEKIRHHNLDLFPDGTLASPASIVDVGANQGDWTAAMLSVCRPTNILCAEPDPKLATKLRDRFRQQAFVAICETAVGEKAGFAELNLMENPVLNSLRVPTEEMASIFPAFRVKESVRVKVTPLDVLTEKLGPITLLKIDAQGLEREILAGAAATLARTECVLLEVNFQPHYEGEAGFVELDALMQQYGFCISNYSPPKGGVRQALFADFLYVRKDS